MVYKFDPMHFNGTVFDLDDPKARRN